MRVSNFLLILLSLAGVITADDCKCPHTATLYEELGCSPVPGPGCCPERYDCSHLEARSKDKCYINGHVYDIGSNIPDEVINYPCSPGCSCIEGYLEGSSAQIRCAISDCFSDLWEEDCVNQYTLDHCCQSSKLCGAENITKLATCELEGETYKEGQRMFPKSSPCKKCICQEGFTGQIEEPFCKTYSCGTELDNHRIFRDLCAPIYLTDNCCLSDWRCHKDYDVIIPGPKNSTVDTNLTCKFGPMTLNLGDTFDANEKCVTCGCFVPPLASCIKDRACIKRNDDAEFQKLLNLMQL